MHALDTEYPPPPPNQYNTCIGCLHYLNLFTDVAIVTERSNDLRFQPHHLRMSIVLYYRQVFSTKSQACLQGMTDIFFI